MELDEVVGRVLRRRILLIISMMLAGVLVVLVARAGEQTHYVSDVRFVLDSPDPTSQAQSDALADTAHAIATAPKLVRDALDQVGADRDPAVFGAQNVEVKSLGSSGVLQLTVTDADQKVAVRAANAIAVRLIQARRGVTVGSATGAVEEIKQAIADREGELAELDARIELATAAGAAQTPATRQLVRERGVLIRRLDKLHGELAVIRTEQALRPEAAILDRATTATAAPTGLVPELVIGALLGLVLGVGIAALREVLQPTLGGAPSLSRATGAPVLAELPCPPDECGPGDLDEVADHVQLAAGNAGVGRVEVMSVDVDTDMSGFVAALDQALRMTGNGPLGPNRRGPYAIGDVGLRLADDVTGDRVTGDRMVGVDTGGDPRRTGLVLVSPDEARVADLEPVRNLLGITGWPLLGVVVYRSFRSPLLLPRHRRRRERPETRVDAAAGGM